MHCQTEGPLMRAKFTGRCRCCGAAIEPGQAIEIFMAQWAHGECKRLVIRQRCEEAGPPVELEPGEVDPDVKELQRNCTGLRTAKRRDMRATKRSRYL